MEIKKGVYGLPQAVKLANDKPKLHLAKFVYEPSPITSGLWRHQTRPLPLSLVVDDFGVKYESQYYITHILDSLKSIYKISEDCDVKVYCGLNLEWEYHKREDLVSIPNYVTKSLHKFQHHTPRQSQYAPHQWTRPNYCATKKLVTALYTSPPIP